ncbi:DUF4974 domain-containing protein [Bacteroides uniformis]|uniref:DUF4974 domain-containing protein n=1 Tax=Bacteroides uniformis TaxID=820 RepID=A0A7J5HFW2_BACUN|nr:FecR family protein [Bacteroides uniformis]KAB4188589.1 DUF4974 domain-containing protein [Bacteroides uniformis]MUT98174.1 FecR family protein [Bacteroides uniformis]
MDDFRKYIDSLEGRLPIDDQTLLNNKFVKQEMENQWGMDPEVSIEHLTDKKEIWKRVSGHIDAGKRQNSRYRNPFLRWYGVVATILLIFSVGTMFFYHSEKDSYIYVVCTGNQDRNIFTLDDGTNIRLGAGSKLTYPDQFPSDKRVVKLDGQAFFDVASDTQRPFSVEVGNVIITALGTSFEVFCDKHNNTVETILLTGRVKVDCRVANDGQQQSRQLEPNQKLTVCLNTGKINIEAENADRYSAWRNYNGLDFNNEQLSVIIPRLEYWYGCKIHCDSEEILSERFSFKVKNESLDRILDLMSYTSALQYKKDRDNTVYTLIKK